MVYRIVMTIGYRDAYIEFDTAKEAADFAGILLEHYVKPSDEEKLAKVSIQVVNPEAEEEE